MNIRTYFTGCRSTDLSIWVCPCGTPTSAAKANPRFNHLFGIFGDAQIGPIYLGFLGVASSCALRGDRDHRLNMLASVNWSPQAFMKNFFCSRSIRRMPSTASVLLP